MSRSSTDYHPHPALGTGLPLVLGMGHFGFGCFLFIVFFFGFFLGGRPAHTRSRRRSPVGGELSFFFGIL